MTKANKCLVCGDDTDTIVNIHLKAKNVCDTCCNLITKQNVIWLINEELPRLNKLVASFSDTLTSKGDLNEQE